MGCSIGVGAHVVLRAVNSVIELNGVIAFRSRVFFFIVIAATTKCFNFVMYTTTSIYSTKGSAVYFVSRGH